MKYTLAHIYRTDENCFIMPIREKVEVNEAIDNIIGISERDNALWLDESIDIYDADIQDFLIEYFKSVASVNNFIRRVVK